MSPAKVCCSAFSQAARRTPFNDLPNQEVANFKVPDYSFRRLLFHRS